MGWAISELCGSLFSDLEKYYCAFFVKKNIFAHSLTVNFLFYLFDYYYSVGLDGHRASSTISEIKRTLNS